jgi:hypothetical protein
VMAAVAQHTREGKAGVPTELLEHLLEIAACTRGFSRKVQKAAGVRGL